MPHQSVYKVIGIMSGSSLDGVDLAYCVFTYTDGDWQFVIEHTDCIPYTEEWTNKLRSARALDGRSLWKLHSEYGHLLGKLVAEFVEKHKLKRQIDLIASHGHTIFHFPDEGFTTQIGDGAAIATETSLPVVCDLRSSDVALGGSGAPIVPIGDRLLFKEYSYLLNIGGIANLTVKDGDSIIAFDICAANQVLDHYARQQGMGYDKDGIIASSGRLHQELYDKLNKLGYYQKPAPKSLDNGLSTEVIIPLIESYQSSIEDKLYTYCEHIAFQIGICTGSADQKKMLITGGGAFNKHLISRIKQHTKAEVIIPNDTIVSYKEALVMAFIGVLRWRGDSNVLSSVTGASRDSINGAIYHP